MSTKFHREKLLGCVLILITSALGFAQSPVESANAVKSVKAIQPAAGVTVERIDEKTGEIVSLSTKEWLELGHAEGRYKNPRTGKYTMMPVMICPACAAQIPACVPDPDAPAEKVIRERCEHQCPKCGKSTAPVGKMLTEYELGAWLECAGCSYDQLKDYTATFYKRERVDGELLPEERIEFKFRKPFMVYMKWIGEANKGQECLYVRGKYDNKLVARGSGLKSLAVVKLDPKGKTAMSGTRHPITDAGIGHLIDMLSTDRALAARHGEGKVVNKGQKKVKGPRGSPVRRIQEFSCTLPKDKRPEYYCHRADITFDAGTGLPVSISIYDGKNRLLEHYRYENLKLDVGLTEKTFDKDNEDYRL